MSSWRCRCFFKNFPLFQELEKRRDCLKIVNIFRNQPFLQRVVDTGVVEFSGQFSGSFVLGLKFVSDVFLFSNDGWFTSKLSISNKFSFGLKKSQWPEHFLSRILKLELVQVLCIFQWLIINYWKSVIVNMNHQPSETPRWHNSESLCIRQELLGSHTTSLFPKKFKSSGFSV